jgi:hypothetical protein
MVRRLTPYTRLERAIRPWVRNAELDCAIARCEAELAAMPPTDYHAALGRSWFGQIREASRWLASTPSIFD